jgi:molybdopterin converting factor small subunit
LTILAVKPKIRLSKAYFNGAGVALYKIVTQFYFIPYFKTNMKTHVHIKLFATLRKYLPDSPETYPIDPGISIKQLIEQLGIPVKDVKLIFINSVKSGMDAGLKGGETIGLFPPVGGG